MKTTTTPTPSPSRGVIALIALGALESALAIYQWIELVSLRNGGQTVCSINETVNCNTVWNSPFASKVHDLLGMPVAGVGLVWGLAALALPVALFLRERSGKPSQPLYLAIRIVAAVGALSVIPLAIGSFSAGAVCLTCLATYVFAIAYAVVAFVQLPKPVGGSGRRRGALGRRRGARRVPRAPRPRPGDREERHLERAADRRRRRARTPTPARPRPDARRPRTRARAETRLPRTSTSRSSPRRPSRGSRTSSPSGRPRPRCPRRASRG